MTLECREQNPSLRNFFFIFQLLQQMVILLSWRGLNILLFCNVDWGSMWPSCLPKRILMIYFPNGRICWFLCNTVFLFSALALYIHIHFNFINISFLKTPPLISLYHDTLSLCLIPDEIHLHPMYCKMCFFFFYDGGCVFFKTYHISKICY